MIACFACRRAATFAITGAASALLLVIAGVLVTNREDAVDSLTVGSSLHAETPTDETERSVQPQTGLFGNSLSVLATHFGDRFVGSVIRSESELAVFVFQLSSSDLEWLGQQPDLTQNVSLHEVPFDLQAITRGVDDAAQHLASAGVRQFAVGYSLDPLQIVASLPPQSTASDRAAARELASLVPMPVNFAFDLAEARFR